MNRLAAGVNKWDIQYIGLQHVDLLLLITLELFDIRNM